ncbi:MAG TPA: ferredoxin [Firmicutes bacterium]|nr:ferredoxin [Bacillota bacterium]
MKKVKVNADACIGCGLCISSAPEVFAFNDEGKSEVIGQPTDEAAVEEVIASCPVAAIEWED